MSIGFVFAQVVGLFAWILLIFSYYRKDTDMILIFHMLAATLFGVHYVLLDAYSGFLICTFELIRDYLYYISDNDRYIFLGSVFFYVVIGLFIYDGIISIFPLFASLLDGFFLTKKKKTVVLGSIIIYILWLGYDIFVKSYSGILFNIIIILSNLLILLFNYSVFGKNGKNVVVVKR